MARGQGQGALSGVAIQAAALPWWAALALAAGAYFGLHALAAMNIAPSEQPTAADYIKTLATALQFLLPLLFVALAGLSAYGRGLKKRAAAAESQPAQASAVKARPRPPPQRAGTSTYMACPKCGSMMYVRRAADDSPDAGKPYWGCSRYPLCKETLEV